MNQQTLYRISTFFLIGIIMLLLAACGEEATTNKSTVNPGTVVLAPVDKGHYRMSDLSHDPTNTAIYPGNRLADGMNYRGFLAFDTAGKGLVAGAITDVTIKVRLEEYNSMDASESLSFYGLNSVTADNLIAGGAVTGAFDDLGTGAYFGNLTITAADAGTTLTLPMGNAGIIKLEEVLGGKFVVGLFLVVSPQQTYDEHVVFSHDGGVQTHELVITQ